MILKNNIFITPVKKTSNYFREIYFCVLIKIIQVTIAILIRLPGVSKGCLYEIFRQLAKTMIVLQTRNWLHMESKHFFVRYKDGEKDNASLVLETAETFFVSVAEKYNFAINKKIPLILYSSREDLNASFNWPAGESVMGVYWGGVIKILSPEQWISYNTPCEKQSIFKSCGPVAHELIHLVVDYKCRGNYPRWLTEGIAQYEEYKLTGFRLDIKQELRGSNLYPLSKMDRDFDSLSDQARAYNQSFLSIEFIVQVYGEDVLHNIIRDLSLGRLLNQAFNNVLGFNLDSYERQFCRWLSSRNYHDKKEKETIPNYGLLARYYY